MEETFLDYNASAPIPDIVLEEVNQLIQASSGNPSSLHQSGRNSRRLINLASDEIARFVDCDSSNIYFTSGATESNSWAIHSAIHRAKDLIEKKSLNRKVRILYSAIEHESIQSAIEYHLKYSQIEAKQIPITAAGQLDYKFLKTFLAEDPHWDLISVMAANNETGVIQPTRVVAELCEKYEIPFHVDAVQALGKLPISAKKWNTTYLTLSAHKVGGMKGTGVLIVQGLGKILTPLIHGKQQKSLRGGTENPVGVSVFGKICSLMSKSEYNPYPESLALMRADFESELKRKISDIVIHGEDAVRLCNTSYIGFKGTTDDGVLMNLDLEGISASSGAACTSGSIDPSLVLLAMGCDKDMARSSIRFSSGIKTTWKDYERVLTVLPEIVERVRKSSK